MGGEEATSESDLMDEVTSASGDDCRVPAAVAPKTRHAAKPRASQKASTHTASSSATATQAAKPKSSHATLGETASSSTSAKLKRGRTSKSKVGGQIPTLRHQESNHKCDAECTSESEETSRITQAAARASQWGRKGKQPTPKPKPSECTSDSETYMASAKCATSGSHPITSGAFDYCSWVIKEVLSEAECEKLAKAPFTYMDLCAGMGTSIISVEAVRRALAERGVTLRSTCTALTEKNPRKREALHRRLLHQFGNPPAPDIFKSNAALAAERPVDEVGVLVSQAIADILFQGIVCVNISNLTSTPKSVTDVDGASGESWMSTLTYLDKLTFETRPKALILECVDALGNKRAVDGYREKGTQQVKDALRERGYVGDWVKVSPTSFYLPQRRGRVWALFLKVVAGFGPEATAARQQHASAALNIVRRCQLSMQEPLMEVLQRIQHTTPLSQKAPAQRKWSNIPHLKFKATHSLTEEFLAQGGRDEFMLATSSMANPREQDAMWLNLCKLRLKSVITDWRHELLVADAGSSVAWLKFARNQFPCVRPTMKYTILNHGQVQIASGALCLAVQGVGCREATAFHLMDESDTALRYFAGNAFTANICCAFLIAVLSVM